MYGAIMMRLACLKRLCLVAVMAAAMASGAAAADWRKDLGIFRIGMLEASAPPQAGRDAIRAAFQQALGMPVELLVLRDWPQLIDAHASARVNYAILSAAAFAAASELCECIQPLAAPIDADGASGLRAVLLARAGKARAFSDVSRIKVATSGPDDLTGWMAPMALLPAHGLLLKGDEAFLVKSATATQAVEQFRDGYADAIFGWERSSQEAAAPLPGGTAGEVAEVDTEVLWRSPLIRFGPHSVLKSLDSEAKSILSKFLADLHGANPQGYDLLSQGHGGGFAAATAADYATVREIVRKAAP